jgi:hypothetical protein
LKVCRNRFRQHGLVVMLVTVCLVVTGCGSDDAPDSTPTPAPSPTAVPPTGTPTPPGVLGEVVWTLEIDGKTNEPGDPIETISRDQEIIYAVVNIEDVPGGTNLIATWSINDQPLDAFNATVSVEQNNSTGYVEFHLTREGELYWPEGTLAITVTTTTGLETTNSIEIT